MRLIAIIPLLFAAGLLHAAHGTAVAAEQGGDAYLALDPFVVNLTDGRRVRFMQVKMQVMADPKVQQALEAHMPAVRDQLIMLFAHQDAATLRNPDGREALRQEALAAVQTVVSQVTKSTGDPATVHAVYFTDFVIQ